MLIPRHHLPGAVGAITLDRYSRGLHEVWIFHLGLAAAPMSSKHHSLLPDLTAITRYAVTRPGYVSSASAVQRLPASP